MTRLTQSLFMAAGLLLPVAVANAQPTEPPPPPERTITIDEDERVDAEAHRPGVELIEGLTPAGSENLLPVRHSFLDRLVESADQI